MPAAAPGCPDAGVPLLSGPCFCRQLHTFSPVPALGCPDACVPLLSGLPAVVLTRLGDVLETEVFTEGEYIVREGTVGDTFYILASGAVRVTQGEAVVRSDTDIVRGKMRKQCVQAGWRGCGAGLQ